MNVFFLWWMKEILLIVYLQGNSMSASEVILAILFVTVILYLILAALCQCVKKDNLIHDTSTSTQHEVCGSCFPTVYKNTNKFFRGFQLKWRHLQNKDNTVINAICHIYSCFLTLLPYLGQTTKVPTTYDLNMSIYVSKTKILIYLYFHIGKTGSRFC